MSLDGIQTSGRTLSEHEARNRDVILDYYGKIIGQWDYDAASEHLGDRFIQHNPTIGDGLAGLEAFVRGCPPPVREALSYKIVRAIVDGDFVVLHLVVSMPGTPDTALIDVFRLEDYKVIEHWDIMQPFPENPVHHNGMV